MRYFCSGGALRRLCSGTMETRFEIGGRCTVHIGSVERLLPQAMPSGRSVVVSDAGVVRSHPELFAAAPLLVGRGERSKSVAGAGRLCRALTEAGADRSTFLLGIGGGIVTDMTGFVASTYMRGISFGFVATTLVGQVDAAIGGKNGVNVAGYKNMMGTFAQPRFVVCDPALTRTLPDREFRAGLAEALKAGLVGDAELFALLGRNSFEVLRRDAALLEEVVVRAVAVKAAVVNRDEHESGERRRLNLGHTVAHAIEKCSGRMNHGEAVAVGTAFVSRAAVRLGLLSATDCRRIEGTLLALGFDLVPPVEPDLLLGAVVADKKREGAMLHAVFPSGIGACVLVDLPLERFGELMREAAVSPGDF